MNTILSVYTSKAYKEFVLPNINNADLSVILEKDIFLLPGDISVSLDVIEGSWRVLAGRGYKIGKGAEGLESVDVRSGSVIDIVADDGTRIRMSASKSSGNILKSEKFFINRNIITIGSSPDNDIVCKDSFVSHHHARIYQKDNLWYIEDTSQNGVFLNCVRMNKTSVLQHGDFINIIGLKIVFLGQMIAVSESKQGSLNVKTSALIKANPRQKKVYTEEYPSDDEKEYFNRAPRMLRELHTEPVEIEPPPAPKQVPQRSMFAIIGPSFTMVIPMGMSALMMILSAKMSGSMGGGLMMFSGIAMAIASAAVGVFWALYNYNNSKKQGQKEEQHRFDAYSDYLNRMTQKIKGISDDNTQIMRETYPSVEECSKFTSKSIRLWNRNENHEDFISHRLGLGTVPFQAEIRIPREKFTLINDSLADRPKQIKEAFSILNDVPICLDMKSNKLIGIVGGKNKKGAYEIMKILSAQIASSNCYTDVKLGYIFGDGCMRSSLSFARWLPHIWSEDKKTRFCSFKTEDVSDVCYELTKIFRFRDEASKEHSGKNQYKPHYIIFIEDISLLEGEPLAKYIFDDKRDFGLTAVVFAQDYENLPNSCECIVYNDKNFTGIYTPNTISQLRYAVKYDSISDGELEKMARKLSKIEVAEVETGGEIPASLTFLDMYGVERVEELNVLERWKKNRTYDNMRALIGQKAGGTDCYLDIHEKYHGPHGLVAGTTGSGKSETLQTYILSLAVNYSPEDISFLLVDFKGGGMANLFTDLPHTIGRITNLSGAQVRRAMISIKSENLRRQRILGEHGVNNINAYTRLLKNKEASVPMPHLFIIIDEFAELKKEQPEFMSELISVAQVGRSLGVHLILATQKPGGTVNDNIRSNSKFKLCLRVQDKQDSTEMLGRPEAAYLSQAGRCYLQVGNDEIFELFQSGWSGAPYDSEAGSGKNPVRMLSVTGRTAMSGNKTALKQKEATKLAWLLSFAQCIYAAAQECEIELSDAVYKTEKMNELLNSLFEMLEQMDMGFARSRHNEAAVKNLVELLGTFGKGQEEKVILNAMKMNVKLPEPKEMTQLDAVIDYIKDTAQKNGYKRQPGLWLPMLPEYFTLGSIGEYSRQKRNGCNWQSRPVWSLIAPVGMFDDPENQAQMPLCVDFSNGGHLAVCGNVTSGKSTFLQTLIYSLINLYSPEQLNIYALDFSNQMLQAFEKAPHVGGVMIETELEKTDKFFNMLELMLRHRKRAIGGNYGQYVKINGYKYPSVVIVIDNYAGFREKTDDKYEKILWEISRDGAGFGIFLALSAGGFGVLDIQNKIAENLRNVVALDMGEKMKYIDILRTNRFDVIPSGGIRGRGLAPYSETILEFQTAVCLPADDDYARMEKIRNECEEMRNGYKGRFAMCVPEIPEKPTWETLSSNGQFIQEINRADRLPIAYDSKTAAVYSVNLAETFCYIIQGKRKSGRTTLLKIMAASAARKGAEICIIDSDDASLERFSEKIGAKYAVTQEHIFNFCKELTPVFQQRNAIKKELVADDAEDEEIFAKLSEEKPIFVFVSDFGDFLGKIYSYNETFGTMNKFFENILEKGRLHNIYFVFDSNSETSATLSTKTVYKTVAAYGTGVHLGGNLGNGLQKVFDVSRLTYQEQSKTYRVGEGMAFGVESNNKIIIPSSKGL